MKRLGKNIIIWFPIFFVIGQLACNVLYVTNSDLYAQYYFYAGAFFSVNIPVSILLVAYTFYFRFCSISRVCAIAELSAALVYLIIKEDNVYNIAIQGILFTTAIVITALFIIIKPRQQWIQQY